MKDISRSDVENNIPLVARKIGDREVRAGNVLIGGNKPVIMAGPCTVESETQIFETAKAVKDAGAQQKMDDLVTKIAAKQGKLGLVAIIVGLWIIVINLFQIAI